jgi:hypothetical protein
MRKLQFSAKNCRMTSLSITIRVHALRQQLLATRDGTPEHGPNVSSLHMTQYRLDRGSDVVPEAHVGNVNVKLDAQRLVRRLEAQA